MSGWSQEDVDRHNAKLGAKMPAHVAVPQNGGRSPAVLVSNQGSYEAAVNKSKRHKYRAIPCIVSADLTLFTQSDIARLDVLSGNPLAGTGSLIQQAERSGIYGLWFASTKEAKRWVDLKSCEAIGTLRDLRRQVPLELLVNGVKIGRWDADFVYEESTTCAGVWTTVYEDSKGIRTPLYKRSKAHVEAQYGIKIRET